MNKGLSNILIGIVVVFVISLIIELIGINVSSVVPKFIEWATKFIFPWIVLYWLIRLVKALEKS